MKIIKINKTEWIVDDDESPLIRTKDIKIAVDVLKQWIERDIDALIHMPEVSLNESSVKALNERLEIYHSFKKTGGG